VHHSLHIAISRGRATINSEGPVREWTGAIMKMAGAGGGRATCPEWARAASAAAPHREPARQRPVGPDPVGPSPLRRDPVGRGSTARALTGRCARSPPRAVRHRSGRKNGLGRPKRPPAQERPELRHALQNRRSGVTFRTSPQDRCKGPARPRNRAIAGEPAAVPVPAQSEVTG
jgi:hypothetical protein